MNNTPAVHFRDSLPAYKQQALVDYKKQLITKLVKTTFRDLAISLTFTGITCLFTASPSGMITLFACSVGYVAISCLMGRVAVSLAVDVKKDDYLRELNLVPVKNLEEFDQYATITKRILKCAQYFSSVNIACIDLGTRDLLLHEGGHALAAHLLYKHADPQVTVIPTWFGGNGGSTTYHPGYGLTSLGEHFGPKTCDAIVSAAGTGATFIVALINLVIAYKVRHSHPELSRYLKCMAGVSIGSSCFYALSAFWSRNDSGHDFVSLALHGINPIAATVVMVAMPLIIKGGFALASYLKESYQAKKLANNKIIAPQIV